MFYLFDEETTLEQVQMISKDMEMSLEQLAMMCADSRGAEAVELRDMAGLLRVLGNTAHIITAKVRYLSDHEMNGRATA